MPVATKDAQQQATAHMLPPDLHEIARAAP